MEDIAVNVMRYLNGELSGKVTIFGIPIEVPTITVDVALSRSALTNLLIDKALELNPDLVLIKPKTRLLIEDGKLHVLKGNKKQVIGTVVDFKPPVFNSISNN